MILNDFKKLNLPDEPGVYFFLGSPKQSEGGRDAKNRILYIGKATSLRDRVKSYFSKDIIFTRGPVVENMVSEARTVTFVTTDSVLEALILEANLIKKHQPRANVQQKDDKSYNYVVISKEKFPRVLVVRGKDVPKLFPEKTRLYSIGPFPQGGVLKSGMKIIRRIFPFRDTCLPAVALAKAGRPLPGRPCFNRQIGLCPGVCTGEITEKEYGLRIKNLVLFFEAKKSTVLSNLNREMKKYALLREFEKAEGVKRTMFALEHIQDISLIKEEPPEYTSGTFRIEAYDIAHMSGKEMVGVMVVAENGTPKKSDYRKFKIRSVSQSDDTGALIEVLTRRLSHDEWPLPHIIAVDGGIAQRNAAEKVLKTKDMPIPVLSVVKDEHHRPRAIEGNQALIEKHRKTILTLNAESHRFAISYHKKLRRKKFLS